MIAAIEKILPWRVNDRAWYRRDPVAVVLAALTLFLVFGLWIIRPAPVSYAATLCLPLSILLIQVSREFVFAQFRKLGLEFFLLVSIILLALLSVINHSEPFKIFRVIFPAAAALLFFCHFVVVASISREKLLLIPRLMVVSAFLVSTSLILAATVLPPVRSYVMTTYRAEGLFENPIQHTIALAVVFPILTGELALSKKRIVSVFLGALLLLLGYTMFRAGSKMAMSTSFLISLAMFVVIRLRSQSLTMTMTMLASLAVLLFFIYQFGLPIAKHIAPVTAQKIEEAIKNKGNYQSIESRKLLWNEAIRQGNLHWAIGTGAGEPVLGVSHSHNLPLDYYKGTGLFGAAAIVLLCLAVVGRTVAKGLQVIGGIGDMADRRIFACYCGATVYVICNQMSDCFGPSTIGFLWVVYVAGVVADQRSLTGKLLPAPWNLP